MKKILHFFLLILCLFTINTNHSFSLIVNSYTLIADKSYPIIDTYSLDYSIFSPNIVS